MPKRKKASATPSDEEQAESPARDVEESSDSEPEEPVKAKEFQGWKQPLTVDQLIAALSFHPRVVHNMSLKAPKPAKPVPLKRKVPSSSLGNLDQLPPEILHHILLQSEIRAVTRIAQVSILGKRVVDTLPPYQVLMKHARAAMGALGATGLAARHTLSALYDTFCAPSDCVSCGEKAPFLLMPTLERCCCECLVRNPAVQCFQVHHATEAFGLPQSHTSTLAVVHTLPEHDYPLANQKYRKGRIKLVSMRAAKLLGLSRYGSERELRQQLPERPHPSHYWNARAKELAAWEKWHVMFRAHTGPLEPLGENPAMQPIPNEWKGEASLYGTGEDYAEDAFSGMATVKFPSLQPDGEPEKLYWCRGCAFSFKYWNEMSSSPQRSTIARDMPPYGVHDADFELGKARRAHTKEQFIRHLRKCRGARLQIIGLAKPSSKVHNRLQPGKEMIVDAIAHEEV